MKNNEKLILWAGVVCVACLIGFLLSHDDRPVRDLNPKPGKGKPTAVPPAPAPAVVIDPIVVPTVEVPA